MPRLTSKGQRKMENGIHQQNASYMSQSSKLHVIRDASEYRDLDISYLALGWPSMASLARVAWYGPLPGDFDLWGRALERRILNEHALQSRVSFASPPHRQTGVFVVPQHLHFCIQQRKWSTTACSLLHLTLKARTWRFWAHENGLRPSKHCGIVIGDTVEVQWFNRPFLLQHLSVKQNTTSHDSMTLEKLSCNIYHVCCPSDWRVGFRSLPVDNVLHCAIVRCNLLCKILWPSGKPQFCHLRNSLS